MNDNQRCSERSPASSRASLRRPSQPACNVALHDLSQQGCRIDIRGRVEPNQLLWVSLPGLQMLQCRVRWTDGWVAGVEFEQPLHPSVFAHVAGQVGHG